MAAALNKKLPVSTASALAAKAVRTAKTNTTQPDSKQSRVIALLQGPKGSTIDGMMKATGWQKHSVRGFLAAVVRKRLKLKLTSEKVDGSRVYQIATPDRSKTQRRRPKTAIAGRPRRTGLRHQ